ncbi:hypothetical protein BKA62DRAFT_772946 [Auriculariales sp. MPI-PUGE-AT-0066]|nr:hypothetical protein BKA62DRAFT_772946 [Auriculariales sp. MPI-PUGE-AT-0066]
MSVLEGGLFPGIFGGDNAPSGPPPALPHVPAPAQHSVTSALGIMHTLTSTRLPSPFGDDDLPPNHHVGEPTTTPVSESASQSSTAAVGVAAPNSPVKVAPPSASSVARPGTPARVSPGERKLKTGQTVGIFAGTFVGCIGLLVLGWYWRRFARAVGLAPHTDEEPDVILPVSESKASDGSVKTRFGHARAPHSRIGRAANDACACAAELWGCMSASEAMEVSGGACVRRRLTAPHEVPSRQPQWQPQQRSRSRLRVETRERRTAQPIPRHANMF